MNIYGTILIILSVTASNMAVFFIASKGKFESNKKKNVIINPVKIIKNKKEEKEIKARNEYNEKILQVNLENIENYNGDGLGQKDIPIN